MNSDLMPAMARQHLALREVACQSHSGAMAETLRDCQATAERYADALLGCFFRVAERECRRPFRLRSRELSFDACSAEMLPARGVPTELRLDPARAAEALPAPDREQLILPDALELCAAKVAVQADLCLPAVRKD